MAASRLRAGGLAVGTGLAPAELINSGIRELFGIIAESLAWINAT
jgi:hypothetical protein